MDAVTEMPAPLIFTDNAASKVKQLIEEEGNPELKLRVFVTGGGCSGFQYGLMIEENGQGAGDQVLDAARELPGQDRAAAAASSQARASSGRQPRRIECQ